MRIALLAVTLAIAFLAKAWALDSALVGAWQYEQGTIEFYADGRFLAHDGRTPIEGTWQAESGKITLTLTAPGSGTNQTTTCDYRVEGDKLTITGGEGCGSQSMDRIVAVVPAHPDRPLLGTWAFEEGTVEFRADGTLILVVDERPTNGQWAIEGGQITLTITMPDNSTQIATCAYTIEHNTLTITGDSQSCGTVVFRRIS